MNLTQISSGIYFKGRYAVERVSPSGIVLGRSRAMNDIMLTALNDLLDIYFRAGSPASNWYMGLISGTVTVSTSDTISSHSGWTENEDYSEATRPEWAPAAAATQKIDNTSSVQFTMDDDVTITGLFIVSENTKGGTSGTLWSAAALDVNQEMKSGETLRGFYDLTASGV